MIELTVGKKTGKELAEWFGTTVGHFRNTKAKKLEELKLFAEFYEENGKVVITKVIEPVYQKGMANVKRKVIEKIEINPINIIISLSLTIILIIVSYKRYNNKELI